MSEGSRPVGRPPGVTGKYKDDDGNPIGVNKWRKLHPEKWNDMKAAAVPSMCFVRIKKEFHDWIVRQQIGKETMEQTVIRLMGLEEQEEQVNNGILST